MTEREISVVNFLKGKKSSWRHRDKGSKFFPALKKNYQYSIYQKCALRKEMQFLKPKTSRFPLKKAYKIHLYSFKSTPRFFTVAPSLCIVSG